MKTRSAAGDWRGLVAVQVRPDSLSYDGLASVALIWLMADDATFSSIPEAIVSAAVETALLGRSILVLAGHREIGAEIRDGLLQALEPISTAATELS